MRTNKLIRLPVASQKELKVYYGGEDDGLWAPSSIPKGIESYYGVHGLRYPIQVASQKELKVPSPLSPSSWRVWL